MSNYQRLEEVLEVKHLDGVPRFAQGKRAKRGAKGQGLRYEAQVHAWAKREFGDFFIPGPWFSYRTRFSPNLWNYAQMDGLLFDFRRGQITIIEVKYSHTADAYFQLVDKYLPLARKFFGEKVWSFATVEVVFWYDKAVSFPTEVKLRKDIRLVQPRELAVHICRP